MKPPTSAKSGKPRSLRGFTVVEFMVATLIGSLILAVIVTLSIYGMRSFAATSNYIDLDAKSRVAVDQMSRDLREATGLTGVYVDANTRWLTFDIPGGTNKLAWDVTSRVMTTTKNGVTKTNLTECDLWEFQLFARAPTQYTTNKFTPFQGGLNHCKLVSMTWRCSRTMMGKKWNTETVQTTKVVLRNAQ